MNRNTRATLALLKRVAQVREVQAKQQLSNALGQERRQQERVNTATGKLRDTDLAISKLDERGVLDLARMGLYRKLACVAEDELIHEQSVLIDYSEERFTRASDLVGRTRYSERVAERLSECSQALNLAHERRGSERQLEAWVLRMQGTHHE